MASNPAGSRCVAGQRSAQFSTLNFERLPRRKVVGSVRLISVIRRIPTTVKSVPKPDLHIGLISSRCGPEADIETM
jgi:hypothetical protein